MLSSFALNALRLIKILLVPLYQPIKSKINRDTFIYEKYLKEMVQLCRMRDISVYTNDKPAT